MTRTLTILASTFATLALMAPLHAERRLATQPMDAKVYQPRVEKMIRAFARRAEALRGRPLIIAKADLPRR